MPDLNNLEKSVKEKQEKEKNKFVELNYETLKKAWDDFCIAKKSQGYSDEFVTLSNAMPDLVESDPNLISVEFENKRDYDHFNTFKDDFLKLLSRKLRKPEISFKVSLIDRSNEKQGIFTDEDKFKFIAEHNPSLIDLQKKLGLDFEY